MIERSSPLCPLARLRHSPFQGPVRGSGDGGRRPRPSSPSRSWSSLPPPGAPRPAARTFSLPSDLPASILFLEPLLERPEVLEQSFGGEVLAGRLPQHLAPGSRRALLQDRLQEVTDL